MALVLRQTTYNAVPPKDDTLTFGELDGNFIDLDQKIENLDSTKQTTLVSGTSIKTVNNETLLGLGNIDITSLITSIVTEGDITYSAMKYSVDDDGTISGGGWAIDYTNGPVIKATAGANITTITTSNWPTSGTAGHLKLMLINFGAYTITFPASWNWIKSDLSITTSFVDLGVTLPSSGVAFMDLFTIDGGTTVYATITK